ncbi:MAG: response regulator transcription factor [Lentisphaeraceae bacterium]|nr:response regulator transcription factor [Lentisphaeraceae bacterium]
MKVLIAEDDEFTREGLVDILETEGYQVASAADGQQAIDMFDVEKPDFVCLDIMMPFFSGYDVCRNIRAKDQQIPIIFLSAKSEEIDKVIGLELGADDYIVKPFGIKEVIARIRAVTRRCLAQKKEVVQESFHMKNIEVYPQKLCVKKGDENIDINLRDLKILEMLYQNKERALSRAQIFKECWGMDFCENTRSLDQKISQLRKLIENDAQKPEIIKTVHGMGYIYSSE